MYSRLLETNGTVKLANDGLLSSAKVLMVGEDTVESLKSLQNINQIVVNFSSSSDGRGFSMASALRERRGYDGKLFAGGQLIPDQVTLAFQCGFDAVIVDSAQWSSYGKDAWMRVMTPVVSQSYLQSHWCALDSIWKGRAVVQ